MPRQRETIPFSDPYIKTHKHLVSRSFSESVCMCMDVCVCIVRPDESFSSSMDIRIIDCCAQQWLTLETLLSPVSLAHPRFPALASGL